MNDELIKQVQSLVPLLVPVTTGLLALGGSWFGTKLGRTTEHKQWLRNQKLEVYADTLAALQTMLDDCVEMHDGGMRPATVTEGAKAAREANTHMSRFRLIAPESLREPAELANDKVFQLIGHVNSDEFGAAGEDASEALTVFHRAATNDLHSKRSRHI